MKHALMKRPHVVDGHRLERRLMSERRVSVWRVAIEQPHEHPLGDRARQIAQLNQPVEPLTPQAFEVVRPDSIEHCKVDLVDRSGRSLLQHYCREPRVDDPHKQTCDRHSN